MKYHTLYISKIGKDFAKYVVCCSCDWCLSISYRFKAVNLSFTVVPIGHEPMPGPLLITYPQSNFDPDPTDPVSMLLHWNPGKWTKPDNIGIIHRGSYMSAHV